MKEPEKSIWHEICTSFRMFISILALLSLIGVGLGFAAYMVLKVI